MSCSETKSDSEIGLDHVIQSWFKPGSNSEFALLDVGSCWSITKLDPESQDPSNPVDFGWVGKLINKQHVSSI